MKKKIVFWGAGKYGAKALEDLNAWNNQLYEFKGFADSNKKGTYCGFPIIALDQISTDTILIITIADARVIVDVYTYLFEKGYRQIFWYYSMKTRMEYVDFTKECCISCKEWGDAPIAQVEMHLIDYCNLNCKGCTHYSPIFPREIPNAVDRIKDVKKVSEKFTHILRFYLLGGEPFLHPDIILYIEEIRKILPRTELWIVTNGLLIPKLDKTVFDAMRYNRIKVCVSEYKPVHDRINDIKQILEENNICYEIRGYDKKQKFNKPLSVSENSKYPFHCISDGCVTIWKGHISRCPSVMYIDALNEKFGINLPNEGIISLDLPLKGQALISELKKQIPLCKHCVRNEIEWASCGVNAKLEDFVAFE